MTRAEFLAALRAGLSGLPAPAIDDAVGDYEAHFDDGLAAERSEAEIAAALGDPQRLARELRVEAGLQRWEARRTPASAVAAVFALIGLGAIDLILLLPILGVIATVFMALVLACTGVLIGGGAMVVFAPFTDFSDNPFIAMVVGFGLIAGAISAGALLALATIGLINGLVWYARLHYRALKRAEQG